MAKGTVKWFDAKKGYGFILCDDGRKIFVHHSNISGDGDRSLEEGQIVTFDLIECNPGALVENVVRYQEVNT